MMKRVIKISQETLKKRHERVKAIKHVKEKRVQHLLI